MGKAGQQTIPKDYREQHRLVSTTTVSSSTALTSRSLMLYMIGFGCRQEAAALRVGPLAPGVGITEAQVLQQDRYMMRAWVELNMFLVGYIKLNGEPRNFAPCQDANETDLRPLSEQDIMLELTGFGPDIDEYTLARYLPGKHTSKQLSPVS